jgi:hypothetical protein
MLGKGLPPPRPPDVEIVLPVAPAHAPCACDPPCAPLSPPLATIWHQLWSAFSERAEGFSAKLDAVLKEAGWTPHPSTFGRTMMPSSAPQDGIDRFSTLAPDILNVILRLAGMSATGSVAATCRTLRIMATDQELWRAHVAHFFRESSDDDDSQEPTVVSLAVEGRSELRRWSRALPEEHVIRLDRFVPIGVRVVCEVTQESAHARLSQQPPPPSFDWRRFCCAICRLRVLSEWHWRLDVLRAAIDSQLEDATSSLDDERRRLSSLQLNDYREAQRIRASPPELAMAAALLRARLSVPPSQPPSQPPAAVREASGGHLIDGRGSGDDEEGCNGNCGLLGSVLDGSALEWLQSSPDGLPDLGGKFGENAQARIAPFLERLLSFADFTGAGGAVVPSQLEAASRLFRYACVRRVDESLHHEVKRSTRTSGGGGPSDLCRALRFASAATHWVATSTQTLLLRRQDEQLASVHGLLPSIAVELEAFTRMGTHEFGTGRVPFSRRGKRSRGDESTAAPTLKRARGETGAGSGGACTADDESDDDEP